ncbi:MAG: hypothetical protein H9872_10495 [Candidatus Cellulosilyticum pullistercoris]|uniref:Uncharacterized protein n=1 Tax=Candidatus Cellulosilyticum pullistercoris TaxID=2838521 RepID=A0A9E2KCV8_9FIRM|nr:hypothetical protein [Candidatus Cellulosilyticum pullistercoris]
MDKHITSGVRLVSFDEIYTKSIRYKLEKIDIFLKENTSPFHVYEVATILEIEPSELLSIMETLQITTVNFDNFFTIILNASSDICKLVSRQWKYSKISAYSPEMIAEIYKLNIHKVKSAFTELSLDLVTDMELIEVFKRIHLTVFSA